MISDIRSLPGLNIQIQFSFESFFLTAMECNLFSHHFGCFYPIPLLGNFTIPFLLNFFELRLNPIYGVATFFSIFGYLIE